jgi:hypothetical protein
LSSRSSAGLELSPRHTASSSTGRSRNAPIDRNTTPSGCSVAADAGTSAIPIPERTSTSIVCTCVTYCTYRGVAPAMVNVLISSSLKYLACTGEYITTSWPSRSLRVS